MARVGGRALSGSVRKCERAAVIPFPSRYHSSSDMTGPSLPSLRLLMLMTGSGRQRRSSSVGGRSPTTNSIPVRRLSSFGPALGGVIKYRFVERTQSRHLRRSRLFKLVCSAVLTGSACPSHVISCHPALPLSLAIIRAFLIPEIAFGRNACAHHGSGGDFGLAAGALVFLTWLVFVSCSVPFEWPWVVIGGPPPGRSARAVCVQHSIK